MVDGAAIIQWNDKPAATTIAAWSWQGNGNVRRLRSKLSGLVLDVGGEAVVVRQQVNPPPVRVQRRTGGRPSLHLRSGDTIPCEVTRIDEKGVTFKTALSEASVVPHEKIQERRAHRRRRSPAR